jgi:hypothetical protein
MHLLIACDSLFEILFAFAVPDMVIVNRNSLRCNVTINATRDQNADCSGTDIPNNTGRIITEPMWHLLVNCSMNVNFNEISDQEVRNSMEGGGRVRFLFLRANQSRVPQRRLSVCLIRKDQQRPL